MEFDCQINVEMAIAARAIMDNDLSRIFPATPAPQLIWYPHVPEEGILELLRVLRPDMIHQVARACIVGNYQDLYNEINPAAHFALIAEAKASGNPHFLQDQEYKVIEADAVGLSWKCKPEPWEVWRLYTKDTVFEATCSMLPGQVSGGGIGHDPDLRPDCVDADLSFWELIVSVAPHPPADSIDSRTPF